ncbi:hypothetical protein CCYA_CCYA09G2594 [Cyanidiococcus yangmingshanensis]|nr:hypothetical protein CCYA_CCYA09G2594 [Cyanidiococcus yangmingshanensis]
MSESKWARDLQEIFGDSSSDESERGAGLGSDAAAITPSTAAVTVREQALSEATATVSGPSAGEVQVNKDRSNDRTSALPATQASDGSGLRIKEAIADKQHAPAEQYRRRQSREYCLLRLPFKFIGVEALENAAGSASLKNDLSGGTATGLHRQRAKKPLLIRWRRNPATGEWESNTRLIQWSDGSRTLHIGGQVALELTEEQVQSLREHVLCGDPRKRVVYQGEVTGHVKVNVDRTTMRQLLTGAKASSTNVPTKAIEKRFMSSAAVQQTLLDTGRNAARERRVQVAALDRAPENEERTLLDIETQRRKAQMRVEARRRRRGLVSIQSEHLAPRQLRIRASAEDQRDAAVPVHRMERLGSSSESSGAASEADDTLDPLDDRRFGVRRRTSRDEDAELERLEAMLEDDQETDGEAKALASEQSEELGGDDDDDDDSQGQGRHGSVEATEMSEQLGTTVVEPGANESAEDAVAFESPRGNATAVATAAAPMTTAAASTTDPSPVSTRRRIIIPTDEDEV